MHKKCFSKVYLSVFGVDASANAVDLFVHLSAMVVSLLTSTGDREGHTRRMPSTDASYLTQTLVRLAGKLLSVPTRCHTYKQKHNLDLGNFKGNKKDFLQMHQKEGSMIVST